MALKSYKPTTPGQRGLVLIDRSELWKGRPVKALTEGLTKSGGRNNTGRITMRRRGGGAKRLYRVVDFKRNKMDVAATVERIEYDPNRTAFIALIKYEAVARCCLYRFGDILNRIPYLLHNLADIPRSEERRVGKD